MNKRIVELPVTGIGRKLKPFSISGWTFNVKRFNVRNSKFYRYMVKGQKRSIGVSVLVYIDTYNANSVKVWLKKKIKENKLSKNNNKIINLTRRQ